MDPRRGGGDREELRRRYLRRLVCALRQARGSRRASSLKARTSAVKLAADVSLAMAARGRTAWSRAILVKYLQRRGRSVPRSRFWNGKENFASRRSPFVALRPPRKALRRSVRRSEGAKEHCDAEECTVAPRIQTLRSLVPGSRRLDTPALLEETAGYIAALKLQIQSMQLLADLCSNADASVCDV